MLPSLPLPSHHAPTMIRDRSASLPLSSSSTRTATSQTPQTVLSTSKCPGFFASILTPDPAESHLAGTFAPGATLWVLVFATDAKRRPSQRWKSLTARVTGTSEIRPYETNTSLHTVLRIAEDVPLRDGPEPMAVKIRLPEVASCPCRQQAMMLPSSNDHIEPSLPSPPGQGGAGKTGGWITVQYQIEVTGIRKGVMKKDESVTIPLVLFSPPFTDEIPSITTAPSNREWRISTLYQSAVVARMPAPYAPLALPSAQLEHYITELPTTLNISWRLSLNIARHPPSSPAGTTLLALLQPPYLTLIVARKLIPIVQGIEEAAPAARLLVTDRRNAVEVLRAAPVGGTPGKAWRTDQSDIVGVRLTGVCVVAKDEVQIIRSCNGATQFFMIARIESPGLAEEGKLSAALNVHKQLFVPRKAAPTPSYSLPVPGLDLGGTHY